MTKLNLTDETIHAIIALALQRLDPRDERYNFDARCGECGGWDADLVRALVEAGSEVLAHEAQHAKAKRLRAWNVATDEAINAALADDDDD